MNRLTVLALTLRLIFATGEPAEEFQLLMVPSSFHRLNLTVRPLHYDLTIQPVLEETPTLELFTCPSSVIIEVEAVRNSMEITLHQRNLLISLDKVTVFNRNTSQFHTISEQTFEPERDLYTIRLQDIFAEGHKLEIYIPYLVNLSRTDNVGIYLGHYENPTTGETHYLSTTKLEPYHARKVFPVFDEPSLKATFTVHVGRLESKFNSLSNMEIVNTKPDENLAGWVWDHFERTVLMSSYLLCVIVSDFVSDVVHISDRNKTVATWAPKHDIDVSGGSYGSDTASKLLPFYEKLFNMDYPLRKLDAVALPQFAAGAMENFGLVTYRYKFLIWIPGESTEAERRKVAQVLAHEIVHQWFGNIVTCDWWSEIWLNEGFARYFQFWGMAHVLPEFEVDQAIVNDATQLAMAFDQTSSTHPIKNSAEIPDESAAVFDRISYEKAASVLRMLESVIGRGVLLKGIIEIYLQRQKWATATTDNLLHAIQEAVDMSGVILPAPVAEIMDDWIYTTGYPLLRVNYEGPHTISISQEKFVIGESRNMGSWWIPVKMVGKNYTGNCPDIWIPNDTTSITYSSHNLDTYKLLMVNPDGFGYYRVLYDTTLIRHIENQLDLEHTVISAPSRSQLIDDYFNCAAARYINIEQALQLTKYLGRETSYVVWTTILTHLKPILGKFSEREQILNDATSYFAPKLERAVNSVGMRQTHRGVNATLVANLTLQLCLLNSSVCHEYALEMMTDWIETGVNRIPTDLRPALYCRSAKHSGNYTKFLFERFISPRFLRDSEAGLLVSALGCAGDIQDLKFFLKKSSDSSHRLFKYADQLTTAMATSKTGRKVVLEFAKESLITGSITASRFASILTTLSVYLGRETDINELESFVSSNQVALKTVQNLLEKSIGNIQTNVNWWNEFGFRIHEWIQQNLNYGLMLDVNEY